MKEISTPIVALGLAYDGGCFHGFQTQLNPAVPTIQQCLEDALAEVAHAPVRLIACAGRTDAGVHASAQVVHFRPPVLRPMSAWVKGANAFLPRSIRIIWAVEPGEYFHAQHCAISRQYEYLIDISPAGSVFSKPWALHHPRELDIGAMQTAAAYLLGQHDLTSFRAVGCQASTAVRTVLRSALVQRGELLIYTVEANGFLYHMVRNIMGVLLAVGCGKRSAEWVPELIQARDRTQAANTAPARALCLSAVKYPDTFHLPQNWSKPPSRVWGISDL